MDTLPGIEPAPPILTGDESTVKPLDHGGSRLNQLTSRRNPSYSDSIKGRRTQTEANTLGRETNMVLPEPTIKTYT